MCSPNPRCSALILALVFAGCHSGEPPPDSQYPIDQEEYLQAESGAVALEPISVHPQGRYLQSSSGEPFFLHGDTAWPIAWKLTRTEAAYYFNERKSAGFNTVATRAVCSRNTAPNAYFDLPYKVGADGEFDFTQPLVTDGNDPRDEEQYDYWDHLEFILRQAGEAGIYVFLSPIHGRFVSGPWGESSLDGAVMSDEQAYETAHWIANRYRAMPHIVWVVGQDRSPSTAYGNFVSTYDAIAEGIADGVNGVFNFDRSADYSTTLMTYAPRKFRANSSYWFHQREWLDFNAIQDMPKDQVNAINVDLSMHPAKPTFLYEGRYENYSSEWKEYQVRIQAYQTIFAGGFGHFYGHEETQILGFDWQRRLDDSKIWKSSMASVGAQQMANLGTLMSTLNRQQYFSRRARNDIVRSATGRSNDLASSLILATGDPELSFLWVYSASGRDIYLASRPLRAKSTYSYWFDPRSGRLSAATPSSQVDQDSKISIGEGAEHSQRYIPPSTTAVGKDWVLVLSESKIDLPERE